MNFGQQFAQGVIAKAVGSSVLVAQRDQSAQAIPLVVERVAVGVDALGDLAGHGVLVAGLALQGIAVCEQAPFCVVIEVLLGAIGMGHARQLAARVVVLGGFARRIALFDQPAALVIGPSAGLAGAIGVGRQLAGRVIGQLLLAALGVGDLHRQAGLVVGVRGLVAQRVDLFHQVGAVVGTLPGMPFGIPDAGEVVHLVIGEVDDAAVGLGVACEVAVCVEAVVVLGAVGMQVGGDVAAHITEEPLFVLDDLAVGACDTGVDDAVDVAERVVEVESLSPQRIDDGGQADMLVPDEGGVEAAIVGALVPGLGSLAVGAGEGNCKAVFMHPLQVRAATGAVGVAADEMGAAVFRRAQIVVVPGVLVLVVRGH
ncbi:hypothetical protein D9M72_317580 [compost metagenome]